jgi:hypothetical protein
MQITTSQMHHVIDCFCRRLRKNPETGRSEGDAARNPTDPGAIAAELSRTAAMTKISEQVFQTIAQAGGQGGGAGVPAADKEPVEGATRGSEISFTFNVIDAVNRKQTATLAAGDDGTLIRRLGQLAETRRTRATESWG